MNELDTAVGSLRCHAAICATLGGDTAEPDSIHHHDDAEQVIEALAEGPPPVVSRQLSNWARRSFLENLPTESMPSRLAS